MRASTRKFELAFLVGFGTISAIEQILSGFAPDVPPLSVKIAARAITRVGERLGLLWLREPTLTMDDLVSHYVEILWNGLQALVDTVGHS